MRRLVTIIPSSILAFMLVGCSVVPWVTERAPASHSPSAGKNLCLLESEDCPQRKMAINELIEGLRHELAKGEAVYTPAELRKLENKLREYEFMYDRLMYGDND